MVRVKAEEASESNHTGEVAVGRGLNTLGPGHDLRTEAVGIWYGIWKRGMFRGRWLPGPSHWGYRLLQGSRERKARLCRDPQRAPDASPGWACRCQKSLTC